MSVSKEEILDSIANMTVIDVVDLISAMEKKFGVSAAAATVVAAPTETEAAPVEEKTEFDIVLTSFGEKKVQVIKAIRSVTNLGLKEAKTLVESAPAVVKEALPKEECEKIKKQLEDVGASAEIK